VGLVRAYNMNSYLTLRFEADSEAKIAATNRVPRMPPEQVPGEQDRLGFVPPPALRDDQLVLLIKGMPSVVEPRRSSPEARCPARETT
jgi:hypothetical protein